jgi:uncharacterized protein YbaP (TraB family)
MRRLPVVLIATLTFGFALLACKGEAKHADRAGTGAATASGEAASPAGQITKPFLWKAEKDGKTSWLFGTIHLGVNAERELPPWIADKIGTTTAFVMEADTSDAGAISRVLMRTDGGSLRTDLGPDYWKKLEDAIGAQLAGGIDGMKPFAAMTVLLAKDLPMTVAMDGILAGRARTEGKPLHFLESVEDQIAMIDPWMSPADIKAMLDEPGASKKQALDLLAAYRAGDGPAVAKLFDDQTLWLAAGRKAELYPAYIDALLGKRNRAWAPQIETWHGEGGVFVAVGAGHLVGPGNLIDLLKARGFTITRVAGP